MNHEVSIDICSRDLLVREGGHDQGRRILEDLRARIEDIESRFVSASASASNQGGKKRKKEDDISSCVTKGQKLLQEVRALVGLSGDASPKEVEEQSSCSQTYAELIKRLSAHEKEAGMLLKCILSEGRGRGRGRGLCLGCGNLIPTRELFGQVASVAMDQLRAFLLGDEIARIAIYGIEGIGKTFLMKHLYNYVLKWAERFDYAIWVTFSHQFSIERVQDAVAVALECDLCSEDSVDRRADMLSHAFACLRNFVIFLDDVPEKETLFFSLAQVGIPVPAEGNNSKVVLTTRSSSVPKILDCSATVNLVRFSDGDACRLLKNEARISRTSAVLLQEIPWLLATECCGGVPRRITDLATRMCSIDDPREWRNVLFEERKKLLQG